MDGRFSSIFGVGPIDPWSLRKQPDRVYPGEEHPPAHQSLAAGTDVVSSHALRHTQDAPNSSDNLFRKKMNLLWKPFGPLHEFVLISVFFRPTVCLRFAVENRAYKRQKINPIFLVSNMNDSCCAPRFGHHQRMCVASQIISSSDLSNQVIDYKYFSPPI